MSTLAEFMIVAGADNRPLMLDKPQYEFWKIRMESTFKTYEELSDKEKLQADCDLKATNIFLQRLPLDVYILVNHHKIKKAIRDRVKLLMQGTSLSMQERECKLYDEFDKFSYVKGILWKPILLFPELRVMVPLSNLTTALAVVRNGAPKMKGLLSSSFMSKITKSTGAIVLMVERNRGEHLIRRFLQQDLPTEEAETESNIWDDGSEDDIGDEEEKYSFVNKCLSFQEEPIVLVEEELCLVYETDNEEKESMPVYDTDTEDVIEEEEGFVGK
uniref:Retrovirus-related Pol polyprotein from transposon TNT 1-94 n=1 Tax=Tanacetum cinerariifolium TaxID=118510 RepID=A0A6L2J6K2_TANCI|nr:hypothetical protein [Tanacetum cinerariifolium]